MIIKETREIEGNKFDYTYSDLSVYIKSEETGYEYVDAYDPLNSNRKYVETDKKIETDNDIENDPEGEMTYER